MGRLILPVGAIYADAQIAIYSTDNHPVYAPLCGPIWQVKRPSSVVSSEITLLETLVIPLRNGDANLARLRERIWVQGNATLLPITESILREAARLRATIPALKTPDAIHAATALLEGCALFVTNDRGFARVPGLNLAILDDVLAAP
jgi:predicted nucleic acid-binding protein